MIWIYYFIARIITRFLPAYFYVSNLINWPIIPISLFPLLVLIYMSQKAESLFEEGIARYQQGEGPDTLIPVFKNICTTAPKNSSSWTCLAWLYLLGKQPALAYKAAQKGVKLNPQDPQARINLAIAMLESNKTGVRQHVDMALQLMMASSELRDEVQQNLEEGLSRNPEWASLKRVKQWLFEA